MQFLAKPEVRASSLERRVQFLHSKGLTAAEIHTASGQVCPCLPELGPVGRAVHGARLLAPGRGHVLRVADTPFPGGGGCIGGGGGDVSERPYTVGGGEV